MKKVILYKLMSSGQQEQTVICMLNSDGSISFDGNQVIIDNFYKIGIRDYATLDGKLFPTDGIKFLENLKFNFTSGYLNATDILNDESA